MTDCPFPLCAATIWERFRDFPFYQHGLLAGVAVAVTCGLLGVFVVSKRMAFIGQGISHAAFGGAGLAYLLAVYVEGLGTPLGRNLMVGGFCVATALAIGRLARRRRVSEDSAIGIALVAAMALGVILLDVRAIVSSVPVPPLHDLLFGNLLQVTVEDVWAAWAVALVVVGAAALFFKELLFFAFDSEGAEVFGVPAGAVHYGLLAALAVTIFVTMRLMGVILASALLILPATVAMLLSRRLYPVLAISVATGAGSLILGLFVAMETDLTVGPVVVMVLCAVLAVSHLVRKLRDRRASA